MTKRRRQGWMLFLAGLLLLAGAWLLLKLLQIQRNICSYR